MQTQTTENLLLQIEKLQKRLAQADQLIELIKAGEVDAFAMNKNNKPEVFTLQSVDYTYRVLVENFNEGALNLSEDGLILFANTAFHETLQLSYEKVIGQHISQFIHPDSQETFNELLIKASTGQSKGEINVMAGKNSCPVYVSLKSLYPNLPTVGVIVSNLTERKQAVLEFEAKRQLQNIFSQTPAAIAIFEGPEQKFILANTAYEKIINRKAEDLIGKSLRDVLPELKGTGTFELYDNILNTGEPFNAPEYAVLTDIKNDGVLRQVYFKFSMEPLKNDTGEVYAVLTMTYDITEQVEARKKIEEDTEKLRLNDTLFKTIPDAIIYSDVNGKVITWNESAEELYGFSSEEMIGQIMPDMISTDFINKEQQNWKEIFAEKGHWKGEVIQTCKDGEKIYVSTVAHVIKNNQNEITGYVAVNRNITLQKQAEIKINESEVKYRTLFTSIDQGFLLGEIIRNKEGKGIDYFVHQVNPTYERQTGISVEMVLGKTLLQAFPTVDTWWIDTYAAVVDNHCPVRFEKLFEFTNRWFEIKASPNEQDMFTILFTDITERKEVEEKLKESERRFRIMADAASVLIWTIDANGSSAFYNKTFLDFIGASTQDDISDWSKIVHPDDVATTFKIINRAIAERTSYSLECRLLRADGEWRWVFAQGNPQIGSNNEFVGFVGSSVDITERKHAENEVLEREKEIRKIKEQLELSILAGKIGIWHWDVKNDILYWSNEQKEIYGVSISETITSSTQFNGLINAEDLKRIQDDQSKGNKIVHEYDFRINRKNDGALRWIKSRARNIVDEQGALQFISGVNIDITEEVLAFHKIQESEERFRNLVDTLPQMVWVINGDGIIEYVSKNWKDYTGIDDVTDAWSYMMHPDDREQLTAYWSQVFAERKRIKQEVRLKNKTGLYRWFYLLGTPVLDATGKVMKWVNSLTDINDQKVNENRKDEFISIASHELKTPLTTAKAYLQMLELSINNSDDDAKMLIRKANQSVDKLKVLISELLDVSKMQLGKLNYIVASFNFNEIIESTVENLRLVAPSHKIIKTGILYNMVTGDKERLQQVLINLLTNAIKYSPGAEKVFVLVEQKVDVIQVSVKDTGIGIAQNNLNRIFEKYHRVEEHSIQFQGMGIGLFISHEIIQRHNGKLWVESEVGKGSTFHFTLPASSTLTS